jgi:hypothetical protein
MVVSWKKNKVVILPSECPPPWTPIGWRRDILLIVACNYHQETNQVGYIYILPHTIWFHW